MDFNSRGTGSAQSTSIATVAVHYIGYLVSGDPPRVEPILAVPDPVKDTFIRVTTSEGDFWHSPKWFTQWSTYDSGTRENPKRKLVWQYIKQSELPETIQALNILLPPIRNTK